MPAKAGLYLQQVRSAFPSAAVLSVLLGTALAYRQTGRCDGLRLAAAAAVVALLAAGACAVGDAIDSLAGAGAKRGASRPFSGGGRPLRDGRLTPSEVRGLAIGCFLLAAAPATCLAWCAGTGVLWFGLAGLLGGIFYSAPPLRLSSRGLGEPVAGLCFGVLPVVGACWLQTGRFSADAVLLSLPVALLMMALLVINELGDEGEGATGGKRHWVARLGRPLAAKLFAFLMVFWAVPIVAGVAAGLLPTAAIPALVPGLMGVAAAGVALRHPGDSHALAPAGALAYLTLIMVGVTLCAGLVVAGRFGLP